MDEVYLFLKAFLDLVSPVPGRKYNPRGGRSSIYHIVSASNGGLWLVRRSYASPSEFGTYFSSWRPLESLQYPWQGELDILVSESLHDGNTNWIFATHFSFTHLPTSTVEKTKNYQQKLIRFNDQTQLYDLFYHPIFSYFRFVHYSVLILLILWRKTFNWQATLKRHYCMATV